MTFKSKLWFDVELPKETTDFADFLRFYGCGLM